TDVKAMRTLGVFPLELPAVDSNWLNKVCPEKRHDPSRVKGRSVVGTWRTVFHVNDERWVRTVTFRPDGTCTIHEQNQSERGTRYSGRYRYANGTLTTRTRYGEKQAKITWVNNSKIIYTAGRLRMEFRRVG